MNSVGHSQWDVLLAYRDKNITWTFTYCGSEYPVNRAIFFTSEEKKSALPASYSGAGVFELYVVNQRRFIVR